MYLLILHLLYCLHHLYGVTNLLLFLCKILTLFFLIFQEQCTALFLCYHLLQQLLQILFVQLLFDYDLKLFGYLHQLQLVVIIFKIRITSCRIIITLSCQYFSDFIILLIKSLISSS